MELLHKKSMDTTLKGHGMERREAVIEKMNGMSDSVSSFTLPGVGMSKKCKKKDGQLFCACRNTLLSQITGRRANKFSRAGVTLDTCTTHSYFGAEKRLYITCKCV